MRAHFTKQFKKNYKKRMLTNPALDKRFGERFRIFMEDSSKPLIKDHALSGKLTGLRAFSITGDIRVIYYIKEETAYFIDIGTHNQVYRK